MNECVTNSSGRQMWLARDGFHLLSTHKKPENLISKEFVISCVFFKSARKKLRKKKSQKIPYIYAH